MSTFPCDLLAVLPSSARRQVLRCNEAQWKPRPPSFSFPRESLFTPLLHQERLKPFLTQFSSQCWVQRFLLHWTPFPSPLLWTFKCVCFLNSLLFLNLIIKRRRRGEESEKRVKWRRKSILRLPHLSKHLPSPSPPLPVSARHRAVILSASLQAGCIRAVLLFSAPDLWVWTCVLEVWGCLKSLLSAFHRNSAPRCVIRHQRLVSSRCSHHGWHHQCYLCCWQTGGVLGLGWWWGAGVLASCLPTSGTSPGQCNPTGLLLVSFPQNPTSDPGSDVCLGVLTRTRNTARVESGPGVQTCSGVSAGCVLWGSLGTWWAESHEQLQKTINSLSVSAH